MRNQRPLGWWKKKKRRRRNKLRLKNARKRKLIWNWRGKKKRRERLALMFWCLFMSAMFSCLVIVSPQSPVRKVVHFIGRLVSTWNPPPIFSFWWMWTSKPVRNPQVRNHTLWTFLIIPLIRIYQKAKIALVCKLTLWRTASFLYECSSFLCYNIAH